MVIRRDIDERSDAAIVRIAADVISVPKQAPADSFVLHAPLELLARAALLRHLAPTDRERARRRLVWLADTYAAAGDPVDDPAPVPDLDVPATASRLVAAMAAGELDDTDRYAAHLGARATAAELRRALAAPVVSSLAAAAHASILLYLLPRVAVPSALVRGAARELARYPTWRLHWFEDPDDAVIGGSLASALLDVPMLGSPGSDFIFPVMSQAEDSGLARKLLAGIAVPGVDVTAARRDLSRIAALSMLQEPPDHAPYGWSHCLTMPQAVMGLAGDGVDARTAVAVAATYVVGFRAALGQRPLDPTWEPARPATTTLAEALAAGPQDAAALLWHARTEALPTLVAELAGVASAHHDAHLVKHTLACLDAAAADPSHDRLYLASAASLAGWWAQQA